MLSHTQHIYDENCDRKINNNNYNISTDTAYCEKCGLKHSLSQQLEYSEIDRSILENPPKGTFNIDDWNSTRIGCHFSRKLLIFLLPFACVWSGVSIGAIYIAPLVKGELELEKALFGIPFLLGAMVIWSVTLTILFGKLTVKIEHGFGEIIYGIGNVGWKRKFYLPDVESVCIKRSNVRINNQVQDGICVETSEKEIFFGTTIRNEHKNYLCAYLKSKIRNG